MRHFLLLAAMLMALGGCNHQAPPATPPVITLEQIDSEQCVSEGLALDSDEYAACLTKIKKEREKEQKAAEEKAKKEAREQAKREKAYASKMKRKQLAADKAKCDDYGIKRGTRDFSACLILLDQLRQQQAEQDRQQQALRAQQQAMQAELQAQQEAQRQKCQTILLMGLSQGFSQAAMPSSVPISNAQGLNMAAASAQQAMQDAGYN